MAISTQSRSDAREVQQLSTRSGVLRAARGQASGPHDSSSRKSTALFYGQICLSCSGCALRGWAERPSAQARQPQRVARALPHHGKFAASGECNELRRVAVRRRGWRRTARLCESQKLGQQRGPTHGPILGDSSSARPPRAEDGDSPNRATRSRPMRLRFRSAAFSVARWDFISILLSQNE